ncbi:MerR family transcriptional regulator [Streptomyces sp. NPDC051662]|uniref:MerR family transcriptional regulator n=1 Tax=Streptomyces sp. NPDC051662 TaxID=3154750 RepID=UPI00341B1BDA
MTELSIGDVALRTGLSVHTLRFYEREGILTTPVRRNSGGRRLYGQEHVDWLTVCTFLRASGMPLPEIRRYTELVREGMGNESERLELMRRHQKLVGERIARLGECMDLISHKVRVYEDIVAAGDPGHECVGPGPVQR